jgi:hypothetical protein
VPSLLRLLPVKKNRRRFFTQRRRRDKVGEGIILLQ